MGTTRRALVGELSADVTRIIHRQSRVASGGRKVRAMIAKEA
jgi:hypothetical protein